MRVLFPVVAAAVVSVSTACMPKKPGAAIKDDTQIGDRAVDLTTHTAEPADAERLKSENDARVHAQHYGDLYACLAARATVLRNLLPAASPLKALPIPELVAIRIYTGSAYREINSLLRNKDADGLKAWRGVIEEASSGLNRLPPYIKELRRGARLDARIIDLYRRKQQSGERLTELGFISTTFGRVEDSAFHGNVKFIIKGRSGHRIDAISLYPTEKEVLFPPGAAFRVLSVEELARGAGGTEDTEDYQSTPEPGADPAECSQPKPLTSGLADTPVAGSGRLDETGFAGAIGIDEALYASADNAVDPTAPTDRMALLVTPGEAGDTNKVSVITMEELSPN